jgi:hypothetical protein
MAFVVRHGKQIEVETLETAAPRARRKRAPAGETFALIPHDRGMRLYGQISGAAWIILLELDRLIFKAYGRNPVRLANQNLEAAGMSRNASITVVIFYWRILLISESMGHHDSEIMDDRSID